MIKSRYKHFNGDKILYKKIIQQISFLIIILMHFEVTFFFASEWNIQTNINNYYRMKLLCVIYILCKIYMQQPLSIQI